jgi:hypothetical protein
MVKNINNSEDAFEKDIEIQSAHSSSTIIEDDEIREEINGKGVLREEDGIEVYPVFDETQDEEQRQKDGAVTRTSTKSSWKDPGPPPDGGREAWIQGSFSSFCYDLHSSSSSQVVIFWC